MFQKLQNKAD